MKKQLICVVCVILLVTGCTQTSGTDPPSDTEKTTPTATAEMVSEDSEMESTITPPPSSTASPVKTSSPSSTPIPTPTKEVADPVTLSPEVNFGVYDPAGAFDGKERVRIENIFLPWRLDDASEVMEATQDALAKDRFPLLSIEPWPWEWNGMTKETLFPDIISGKYDSSIVTLCEELDSIAPQEVWIRWGHEMDLTDLFVWSQGKPEEFKEAYRHFVSKCKEVSDNIKFVWSPAGGEDSLYYWPGDEYVDIIGVTVLSFEEQGNSFDEIFGEKYERVETYGLPVIIPEMGVEGTSARQEEWMMQAQQALDSYPLLSAVVYFNAPVGENEYGHKARDYRIAPNLFPPMDN